MSSPSSRPLLKAKMELPDVIPILGPPQCLNLFVREVFTSKKILMDVPAEDVNGCHIMIVGKEVIKWNFAYGPPVPSDV